MNSLAQAHNEYAAQWERVAATIARLVVEGVPCPIAIAVALGRMERAEDPVPYWSPLEQDTWRGYLSFHADVRMSALSDARVMNDDAYAAGSLARHIVEVELYEEEDQ